MTEKSKRYYNYFTESFSNEFKRYILKDLAGSNHQNIRKIYISYPVLPKKKELSFNILYEFYPTNDFITLRFKVDVFCDGQRFVMPAGRGINSVSAKLEFLLTI